METQKKVIEAMTKETAETSAKLVLEDGKEYFKVEEEKEVDPISSKCAPTDNEDETAPLLSESKDDGLHELEPTDDVDDPPVFWRTRSQTRSSISPSECERDHVRDGKTEEHSDV